MTGRPSEFLFGVAAGLALAAGLAGVWPRTPAPAPHANVQGDRKAVVELSRTARLLEGETQANAALRKELFILRKRVSDLSGQLAYRKGTPVVLQIQPGMTIAGVANRLVSLQVVREPGPFVKAAETSPPIRAGGYVVFRGEPVPDILRTITSTPGG